MAQSVEEGKGWSRSEGRLHAVHGALWGRGRGRLAVVQEEVDAAVHSVIVLVGRRRGRWRGCGGGISLRGGVVLCVCIVDEGDVGLRVLYPELRVGHKVVDGAA